MNSALRGGQRDRMGGRGGAGPADRCRPVSASPTPRGLAFVRGCLFHQAATTGVVPYLSLSRAVLGTELGPSKFLLNE